MESRAVPRRRFDWSAVSHSAAPPFVCWERGHRAPKILDDLERTRSNMADSSDGYPNLGDPPGSVAPRGVPWGSAASLCLVGSFEFRRLTHLVVWKGALDARNIREFGRNPRNMADSSPRYQNLGATSGSARFRCVPWCSAVSICRVGSFAFRHLPQLGVGKGGVVRRKYYSISKAPDKIRRIPARGGQI